MELTINDLSKEYGRKKAVNHFSAKLTNGVYGLLGANGAGKTTLMRITGKTFMIWARNIVIS